MVMVLTGKYERLFIYLFRNFSLEWQIHKNIEEKSVSTAYIETLFHFIKYKQVNSILDLFLLYQSYFNLWADVT